MTSYGERNSAGVTDSLEPHTDTWKKRAAGDDTGQCGDGTDTFADAVSLALRMRSNPNKGSKNAALSAESRGSRHSSLSLRTEHVLVWKPILVF